MYKHPGVYIEHVPSGVLSIEAASTSTAAFVGHVPRGIPVTADRQGGKPQFISSISQYIAKFGELGASAGGVRDLGDTPDLFGLAVNAFFANGGSKAYIVPVAKGAGSKAGVTVDFDGMKLAFTAKSAGKWAEALKVRIDRTLEKVDPSQPDAGDGSLAEYELTLFVVNADGEELEQERYSGVTSDPSHGSYIGASIASSSELVDLVVSASAPMPATPGQGAITAEVADFGTATDTGAPTAAEFTAAFNHLRDYRDVSILLMPGQVWKSDAAAAKNGLANLQTAVAHCEFMKNCMVVVDPPEPTNSTSQLDSPTKIRAQKFTTSPYAALYYPWLTASNLHYDPDTRANVPKTFTLPPSAAAAGLWARTDGRRGVWKAPAGVEANVRGYIGPNLLVGNDLQDQLNEWGVNCIRSIIGPDVIWGARTLATKSKPQFRYIPVRRTQNMIGESLYGALQAVVFEPNDHKLWASLRASATDFMDRLHRAGAFQGEKAQDAYFVRCGLDDTMTQADIDAGIVRLEVGFAPLKPAEFVVVQIKQIVGRKA